jgi:hypothetical protein
MELSKRVYEICDGLGRFKRHDLKAFLDDHPGVDVNLFRDEDGEQRQALHAASTIGDAGCMRLLLDHGADVCARDDRGMTPLMTICTTSIKDPVECMLILMEAKADIYAEDKCGTSAVVYASQGNLKGLQLLIDSGVDVNVRSRWYIDTPVMRCCYFDSLPCLQLLLDNKADLNLRSDSGECALYKAMADSEKYPRTAFVFTVLCCNTDAKNVKIDEYRNDDSVTATRVAAYIEDYTHTQAYIDEFHGMLEHTLSTKVEVDTRFGLGENGVYQEPLERTLEYLGLSMHKDQVVNASIDGDGVKRALIPFHVMNAKVWFKKMRKKKEKEEKELLRRTLLAEIRERQEQLDALSD